MFCPRLTINHNHGLIILRNAVVENGVARGIVEGGGYTNRLFHATSHHAEKVGVVKEYPVWSREVRQVNAAGSHNGVWVESPTPGNYHVDVCFCG